MRILLAQNSLYFPSHGGGDKSNRLLVEALNARGHTCLVVARTSSFGAPEHEQFLRDLSARSVPVDSSGSDAVVFRLSGVEVHTMTRHPGLRAYFAGQIADFKPEVIIASTDDPAQLLLEAALRAETPRVVYLARATMALPFGPDCAFPSDAKAEMLRRMDAVVGVSEYVADYIRRWSGIPGLHVPISLLEPGPYLGRFENEFVTLVNPCAVKGISIFLALAEQMPEVRFAAVPTWGTNEADRHALARHSNIEMLPPADDIDKILGRTRVLLVPSLWAEARSRIVVEAMLRGIPVIAANVGGIPEAKLGVDYLLPVRPIEKYQERVDEQMVPVAEVPEQEIGPWRHALNRLVSDREHYQRLSEDSRSASFEYAVRLSVRPFEDLLARTLQAPRSSAEGVRRPPTEHADPLESLSPEKRRLLALRLRQKSAGGPSARPAAVPESNRWFPHIDASGEAKLRLFCFPYAGAGTSAFRGWEERLPKRVAVCPARLPGREARLEESPLENIGALIEHLAQAMARYLDKPFVLFGHSMGAAIAFELARTLRRQKRPLPALIAVSAARAPQFRRNYTPTPAPSDDELIEQLRRLEGMSGDLLENQELLKFALPALRADTTLYRNYIYTEEPPFDCPIHAYCGLDDPNVTREQMAAWAGETTRSFDLKIFPGGHFFIHSQQTEFLEALSRDWQLG